MKVAINTCFGGFGLSQKALLWLWERGMKEIGSPAKEYFGGTDKFVEVNPGHDWETDYKKALDRWRKHLAATGDESGLFVTVFTPDEQFCLYGGREIDRTHPLLIECIETLGKEAFGACAKISIAEIPDGVDWEIVEYDGNEHIAEKHRTWS